MTVVDEPGKIESEKLPAGWAEVELADIVLNVSDEADPKKVDCQYIGLEHIGKASGRIIGEGSSSEVTSTKTRFQPGDVLYGKLRPYLNKVALAGFPGICSTDILALRPLPSIHPGFVQYRLLTREFVDYASLRVNGVQHPRIDAKKVGQFSFLLPPLAEQTRIVAKIEELFSKLDAGVAELKRTQALLKRYRQSVLHAAVTGELSRAWREAQGGELEDAGALLARILEARRAKWAASGKRGQYKEPQGPDVAGLPELPSRWVWASVEQLADQVQYGSSAKTNESGEGIPIYRMGNIINGELISSGFKYLPTNHDEFPSLFLQAGDILFNRTNSAELVGKCALYSGYPPIASFASYLIRLRVNLSVKAELVVYYINSPLGRAWVKSVATQQVGQANVNGSKLQELAFRLPPLAEQSYIVSEVERRLSILANVEATVQAELKRAESTRQGILRRAFSGQLVPQDAADEPASVLLERIKAEKLAAGAASIRAGGKRGRGRKTATQEALLDLPPSP